MADDAAFEQQAPAAVQTRGFPGFSLILIAGLWAAYYVEILVGHGLAPSPATLVQLGGLMRPLVLSGEWWRIFTAPLLHADLTHILGNSLGLFIIGLRLEPMLGSRWLAGTFAVSAVCGSLLSLAINPPNIVGIGASGGIVGLFAAALLVYRRLPDRRLRMRLLSGAAVSLAPALLPFLGAGTHGTPIDYGAHFGGAIGGLAMGLLALRAWPRWESRPQGGALAALAAGLFFILAASGLTPITHGLGQSSLLVADWPSDGATALRLAPDLLKRYPRDPRVRLTYAAMLLGQSRESEAERQLRAGLAETELLHLLPTVVEDSLRATLSLVLTDEGKAAEARSVLGSACTDKALGENVRALLGKANLCV